MKKQMILERALTIWFAATAAVLAAALVYGIVKVALGEATGLYI
jgi:hypothetical protein